MSETHELVEKIYQEMRSGFTRLETSIESTNDRLDQIHSGLNSGLDETNAKLDQTNARLEEEDRSA